MHARHLSCALLVLAAAAPALAAEAPSLARLEVAMWPEFDRPDVLVIYRATLAPDAALPTVVRLPIPAAAGNPHAVARLGADGGLYTAPYTREVEGEWATIAVDTDSRDVQLEYYSPLARRGSERSFSFQWPGGPAVGQLVVEVQQPASATGFTLTPPAAERLPHADGLTYSRAQLGARGPRQTATVSVRYAKTGDELTAPPQPTAAPSAAMPSEQPGSAMAPAPGRDAGGQDATLWLVVAGIAAVAFVAGVLVSRRGGGSAK